MKKKTFRRIEKKTMAETKWRLVWLNRYVDANAQQRTLKIFSPKTKQFNAFVSLNMHADGAFDPSTLWYNINVKWLAL